MCLIIWAELHALPPTLGCNKGAINQAERLMAVASYAGKSEDNNVGLLTKNIPSTILIDFLTLRISASLF